MSVISQGLGLACRGTARMSALCFSLGATQAVGEVAIRGCAKAIQFLSFGYFDGAGRPKKDEDKTFWDNFQDKIQPYTENLIVRPFKEKEIQSVALAALVLSVSSVVLTELVNVLEGSPPPIYNKVLSWMGPIRLSEGFYFPQLEEYSKSLSNTLNSVV